ncbi:sulfotransferase family protein [Prochlorococcus marinus]|uniref:sulfotransferase family protein n=1 Tax=Prochlorococcus marinus TaxID=1219 RepID=UPI00164FA730|nr:sulfotransferase [Prochlorococcus marinus]
MESSDKDQGKKNTPQVQTFSIPFPLRENQENITINTNTPTQPSKEQIINQAFKFHSQGNISEAAKYYQYFINQGFKDHRIFSNYGTILQGLGKSQDAELSFRKAIEINPDYAEAYSNLGVLLNDLGELQDAELHTLKAIEIKPDYAEAHSNLGNILKELGKLQEAELHTLKAIEIKPDYAEAHYNLGIILRALGKLQQAEISYRKAIEIKPDYTEAHSNLGNILKELGKLQEAELSLRKAIELNPNLGNAYYHLSLLNSLCDNKSWQDRLFSESILKNQKEKDLVDIYFARANILEENYNFPQASHFLKKANNLNRNIYGSNYSDIRQKIESCYHKVWEEKKIDLNQINNLPIPIFIVGLPRSGKTITETILACNNKLIKCGEDYTLPKAIKIYHEEKENLLDSNLSKLYFENIEADISGKSFISTTLPMNFINIGLITSQIPTARIIYCYRNPLDNIKETYKKNMGNKNTYSCSIVESANLYIEVYFLMKEYQKRYNSIIYFLNYDDLVTNTGEEIKHLIDWLGWENNNKYLEPNLDPKTIKITGKIDQQRINENEISSWKNYRDLLKPAIQIFNSNTKFRNLFKQYVEEMNQ